MQINRQRWLPPSDFTDRVFGSLPAPIRVTATGLRLYVDDEGRAEVRLRRMLAEIYEHDESMTEQDLEDHLLSLDAAGWLRLYIDRQGRSVLQVRFWPSVQHPEPSRFDPPEGFMKPSRKSHETFMIEERERERAGAGERAGARERASAGPPPHRVQEASDAPEPPSPFCSKHQPWGTEESCGPCRTTRLSKEIYDRAAARVALSAPASGPRFEADRAEPSEYIDDDGRIETT